MRIPAARPLIVQLFNGGDRPETWEQEQKRESEPDHLRAQGTLTEMGLDAEIIGAFGWPWNPLAKRHNAFLGLDPLRALRVLLTRRKAAMVCAHMESAVIILLLRRLFRFRPPVVIWEVPWSPGWAYRERVARLAIPRAACAIVFSSNQIELVRQAYGPRSSVMFVPFCVDVDFYRPQPGIDSRPASILSCGLDAGRDFDVLLEASKDLPASVTIKAGRSLAIDQRAYPNVTLRTDYLSYTAFRDLYAQASIVVVTTKATPNACGVTALMEAMAMGKPTIVSDNPALRDYLPPPDAGVVVPVGDSAALHAALLDLLQNPEKAAAMGRKARAFAEQRFHPRVHFQAMAEVFWPIIEAAGTGTRPTAP
jgi:glycosyltransferase involved in cell wall biosynthesis